MPPREALWPLAGSEIPPQPQPHAPPSPPLPSCPGCAAGPSGQPVPRLGRERKHRSPAPASPVPRLCGGPPSCQLASRLGRRTLFIKNAGRISYAVREPPEDFGPWEGHGDGDGGAARRHGGDPTRQRDPCLRFHCPSGSALALQARSRAPTSCRPWFGRLSQVPNSKSYSGGHIGID